VVGVSTPGDQRRDVPISSLGNGAFTRSLEAALLAGEVDLAVHSAKDLPVAGESAELTLAMFPRRADPRDALLSRRGHALDALPSGALVATGSPRRAALLLARRPDLRVTGVRGNVETRIRKLREGDFDAMILAAAGLERLGRLDEAAELLDTEVMTPAAGQGALAVQCRADDREAIELLTPADHLPTRATVLAERAVLRALGGGCTLPVGAHATLHAGCLRLRAVLADPDGAHLVTEVVEGVPAQAAGLGNEAARRLRERAARELAEPVYG
jgi:hydroxymethylbilane synthase